MADSDEAPPKTLTTTDLEYRTGSQGWTQFLQNKKDMLAGYESAKTRSSIYETSTQHGNVGEALIRSWLEGFLPARYGVTPGYVVSQFPEDGSKLPHFDVIIYDRLESPVLWVDESPDSTRRGTARAIPAEYVLGVLEVKSCWTSTSAKKAIEHLHDLDRLMAREDTLDQRFKKYLPSNFFCCVVCFELAKKGASSAAALDHLLDIRLKGYLGAVVLKGEGLDPDLTGRTVFISSKSGHRKSKVTKNSEGLLRPNTMPTSATVALSDETTMFLGWTWSGTNFADWAFDILAALKGTYDPRRRSSFYAASWRTHEKPPKLAKASSRKPRR